MRSLTHIVERPRVAMYLPIGFVRFFVKYSFLTYLPLVLASRFSIGSAGVGEFMAAFGVGGMLSAASSGVFDEKLDKISTVIGSIFVIGAVTMVIAYTANVFVTIGAMVLIGIADSLMGPP